MRTSRMGSLAVVVCGLTGCSVAMTGASWDDSDLAEGASAVGLEAGWTMKEWATSAGTVDMDLIATYNTFEFLTNAALMHIEFRGRYSPTTLGPVVPWVGGGAGGSKIWATTEDINCRRPSICIEGLRSRRSPIQRLNPHVAAGFEVPLGETAFGLVFAASRELFADGNDWNLNQWRFGGGLRWTPEGMR